MPNSLDALLNLKRRPYAPDYTSVSDDPEAQLYLKQQDLKDDVQKNYDLGQGDQNTFTPPTGRTQPSGIASAHGASLSDLLKARSDVATNPLEGQQQEVDAINRGNQQAITEGFTGGSGISKDYENFYNERGEGPNARVVSASSSSPSLMPMQQKAMAGRETELAKMLMPLQVEQEKTRGAIALANNDFYNMTHLRQPNGGPTPPDANPMESRYDVSPDAPYNGGAGTMDSLGELLGAKKDSFLANTFATPNTKLVQDQSLQALESLQGLMPGARSLLALKAAAAHQGNYGNESRMATFLKLNNLGPIYDSVLSDLSDPNIAIKMNAQGRLSLAQDPQMIMKAKQAIMAAKQLNNDQIQTMRRNYPGIEKGLVDRHPVQGTPVNPHGKVYLDDQGNPKVGR